MNSSTRPVRGLATAAVALTSLFPLIVIVLNLIQRHDYSPTRQAISELALGTDGNAMIIAFCGLGVGIFLLAVSIYRTSRNARVTPLLLALASVLAGPVSAAFHTDRTGAKTTVHGNIHNVAGLAAFLIILVAMITAAYRFRREPAWRAHATVTKAFAALGITTFFLVPVLGNSQFGLAQRLFVGTFVVWLLSTAAHAARVTGTSNEAARREETDRALAPNEAHMPARP